VHEFIGTNPFEIYFCLYSRLLYNIRMSSNLSPADSTRVQRYWQNVLRHPVNQNPMNDNNGNLWQNAQGGDVLYFPGNDAQNHTRTITQPIPPNRRLFVAVNPVVVTQQEAGTNTDLAGIAKTDEDSASRANLTIDTQQFDLLALNLRCPTGTFQVNFPAGGGMWGIRGQQNAVADGYYGIVEPLGPGNHTMTIDAQVDNPCCNQPAPWTSRVTYNFRVV